MHSLAPDFQPEEPAALMAVLYEAATLMQSYLQHVRASQLEQIGDVDCFCLPDEVRHHACSGILAARPEWQDMARFLGDAEWHRLAAGATLGSALQLADAHRLSLQGRQDACYMVVSEGKSFSVLACGHSRCGVLLFDSHSLSAAESEFCGSALLKNISQALDFLCRNGLESLYKPDGATHLYVAAFPTMIKLCACRAPEIT